MTEALESLLKRLCKSASQTQQNAQQTLYTLTDAKDGKLAYDLLIACGLDVKYFSDDEENNGKLYIQNASLASGADKIAAANAAAPLLKTIKDAADTSAANYTLTFANTPAGRQLTLLLPADKTSKPAVSATSKAPVQSKPSHSGMRPKQVKAAEDSIAGGPEVARKAVPKQFRTSEDGEDPFMKRLLLFITGRAFTSTAWFGLFMLILAVIFSVIITIRGFLCPDVAGVQDIPAYCPHKVPGQ